MKDAARLLMIIGAVLFLIGAVWHFAAGPRQWVRQASRRYQARTPRISNLYAYSKHVAVKPPNERGMVVDT